MSPCREEVYEDLKEILADALGVEEDEVTPEATLVGDLGAESIDFLDIMHRLEQKFSIDINNSDLFPDDILKNEEYVQDGKVTPSGLAEMKKRLPFLDLTRLEENPSVSTFNQLLTVGDLCSFVGYKLGQA